MAPTVPWWPLVLLLAENALGQFIDPPRGVYLDPLSFVEPLIGAANGGNVFAGATVPYGLAKASPDSASPSNQGGFTYDGTPITGFSVLHDSGTGGAPSLGNFPLFAYNACPGDDVNRCVFPKKSRVAYGSYDPKTVKARPGYFSLTMKGGPRVEMTTTHHTALFRFNFESARPGDKPLIFQDLSDLSDSRQDNGTVTVETDKGRISGSAVFTSSFSLGLYTAYFCSDFRGSSIYDGGVFVNSRADSQAKQLTISRSINGYPLPGGGWLRFADASKPILARVGVSFVSTAQACSNAEQEMPNFDFEKHVLDSTALWRKKLSPITIEFTGVDVSYVKNFYSGVYRTMVNPQNMTGENPKWNDGEPYFDSFYCIWDLFRSQMPFLTIVDTDALAQMIRSLISTYEHEGWLPDCRMTLNKGYTQGGSNADTALADAYIKGVTNGIDWAKGYEAVKKDAEVEPFDWCCQGRGGLDSWKKLGYIPVEDIDYKGFGTMTRSISRTLEYSYNDYCIAEIAAGLGYAEDVKKYVASSGNWKNLFRNNMPSFWNGTNTGFTGFFQPKNVNQTWGYQDPLICSNLDKPGNVCSLQGNGPETFESSIWEYGFFAPHAHAELIKLYGGPAEFVRRLDYLHDSGITYIGNEPAFLTVFQYHYAGRPGLSAKRSHFYIPRFFAPTAPGLPGNDDSGAMGSFLAFSMMGLFPNAGQNVYLIIAPFFKSIDITSPVTGQTAKVRALNFDASYKNIYIQSATLNGKPYTKNWVDHTFFTEGKELVVLLGPQESGWGTAIEDLPPSLGSYADAGRWWKVINQVPSYPYPFLPRLGR
ncbi:hypothetical protein HIM_09737 [Hirsutella minnesotensis 3608]|uniref:Secreted glycosidase n=1 Tax=Hirsutella minnesotensis 3608 TaxID=1043627 RepID=A0A0F7ZXK3_9HYPO|nr:hypothetical protein HIM_09737 [Hirsutella minnesotensis 3608]